MVNHTTTITLNTDLLPLTLDMTQNIFSGKCGGTWDYDSGTSVTTDIGYWVGGCSTGIVLETDEFSEAFGKIFVWLNQQPRSYVGVWFNNGKVYVDESEHFIDLESALIEAVGNKEKAIWDIANNCEIGV